MKKLLGNRTTYLKSCGSEKDIERDVLIYLSKLKCIRAWKQNTVGVFDQKTGRYRLPHSPFIIRGVADIIGVINGGRFLAIEIKVPMRRNNVSANQKSFLEMINEIGGLAFVATSLEEVKGRFLEEGII